MLLENDISKTFDEKFDNSDNNECYIYNDKNKLIKDNFNKNSSTINLKNKNLNKKCNF